MESILEDSIVHHLSNVVFYVAIIRWIMIIDISLIHPSLLPSVCPLLFHCLTVLVVNYGISNTIVYH